MPMTRELKKRLMGIEDRLGKVEKKRPVQRTNGEEIEDEGHEARLEQIEMVLQIPGERDGDTQVLSAWRYDVEETLKKLEDRLLKVELRGAWTPDEARDLEGRVKVLQKAVEEIQSTPDPPTLEFDDRLTKLEQTPDPTVDVSDVRERLHKLEQAPVAGTLSNIMQDMNLSIEGTDREVRELRSLVKWVIRGTLLLFALILTIILLL